MDPGRAKQWEIWKTMTPQQRWSLSFRMTRLLVQARDLRLRRVGEERDLPQRRLAEVVRGYAD